MRRRAPWLLAALILATGLPAQAAGSATLSISAVVVSRSLCRFLTGARTLDFGNIDPSTSAAVNASTTIQFWCIGSASTTTYSLTAGNGLYSPGAGLRRMRHATTTTELMPYTLNITPSSATIPWFSVQTVTVTGTVVPTDFQNARAGAYSDTVVISLEP